MSEFVNTLERDLRAAATRLHEPSLEPARNGRRAHRYRPLAVVAAVLVVAAPALAGVPGVWRGVLAGSSSPTFTSRPPVNELLAELEELRRPARPADRSAGAAAALAQSGPLSGVSVSDVRYVGVSPIGDPVYLVPYRSRVRLASGLDRPETGTTEFNGHPPPPAQRATPDIIGKQMHAFLNQPGACLIGVAAGTPEIDDCASAGEIAAGTDYTTVGVYRTQPQEQGAPAPKPGTGHVIASIASGIVPDHVARVRLAFATGKTVTIPVQGNHFAFIVGHAEGGVPTITWLAADGHVMRRTPRR